MKFKEINNISTPLNAPLVVKFCDSFLSKLRGYTFKIKIEKNEGALLVESVESRVATSIHMIFVFFKLGIVWINDEKIIVDKRLAYPFISFLAPKAPAFYVLEVHPERLKEFSIGDKIEII